MDRRSALRTTALGVTGSALAPTLLSLLQSCQNTPRLEWTPTFLTEDRAQFLSALVDTILPRTETPGGLDVKVDVFIDRIFSTISDSQGQDMANAEIDKMNLLAKNEGGSDFHQLSGDQRAAVVKQFEVQDKGRYQPGVWGTPVGDGAPPGFYRSLKSMILWGYFTSQQVGEEVLNYDPIPGVYQGCIPLEEVGRLWSL